MSQASHKIFISYAKIDLPAARQIYEDLLKAGLDPWLDEKDLLPGQNWQDEIKKAIRASRFFIAILSNRSVSKRGFVQREIKLALQTLDEYPESEVFVIPARLDACEPSHEKLRELHWVDLFPSYADGFKKILATVQKSVRPPSGNGLIDQLIHGTDAERIEAAKAIRSSGWISALPELIRLMQYDPERSRETIPVRNAARDSILYLAGEYREGVVAAMQRIIKDQAQHRYIRRRAVYILGKLEAHEALGDLVGLTDDPDFQLRCKLVDALKHFKKHEMALSALMKLNNDPSKEIQERARDAMSK
jgi:hypothetical protein